MAQGVRNGGWASRFTTLALILSIGGVAAALVAALGSGQGAWHFRVGFTILRYAFFAAIAGGFIGLVGLIVARRRGAARLISFNLLALVIGMSFLLYLGQQIRTARTAPAIHDVATNLDDLPQFAVLKVRKDNLENIPDQGDPALKAMDPESRWKAIHRQAYSDLRTLGVPWPVEETVRRAEQLARSKGWDIANVDAGRGLVEATDTTRFFRFKDDVVVRVRPDQATGGSLVDMRSISRVGGSDLGVNAKRVREFLADLRQS